MTEKSRLINRIIELLGYLSTQVTLSNSINLYDKNIISENFYRDFLNELLNLKLNNINIEEKNAAAIDLGDQEGKIAFQITSTRDLSKTRKTVKKFIDRNLHYEYDRLILLNIVSKSKHSIKEVGQKNIFTLSTEDDIWDQSDLLKKINDLKTPEIKSILDFLEKEIKVSVSETIPNELVTFNKLIELISKEDHIDLGKGFIEEPDPDGKINRRFADHSDFLKAEYREHYSTYGKVLDDVKNSVDLSHMKLRKLGAHLRSFSDGFLSEVNGNPKIALNNLVDHYTGELSKAGINYDLGAIKFYLVDQLIACNVFPNYSETNL